MYSGSWRSHPISEYWPKICSSQGQTGKEKVQKNTWRCFKDNGSLTPWLMFDHKSHMLHVTCVCWPPRARCFKCDLQVKHRTFSIGTCLWSLKSVRIFRGHTAGGSLSHGAHSRGVNWRASMMGCNRQRIWNKTTCLKREKRVWSIQRKHLDLREVTWAKTRADLRVL